VATDIGAWPQGLSIIYAVDGFAALLLTTMAVVAGIALAFAAGRGEDRHPMFLPMANVLLGGVFGSLVTADLFNLFVAYEVMLIASYVLLTLRGGRRQVRAGVIYVVVNLLASTAFLLGTGLLYGVTGTVNLAALHTAVPGDPAATVGAAWSPSPSRSRRAWSRSTAGCHGAYVEAGPAVTALFSGLLTKVGVYTLFRLYSVVFAGDPDWRPLLVAIAAVTMVVGVLGAVGRGDVRGILAFHMVSQVGYLVLPLGLWTTAAVTGGIVYLLQYIFVKGSLFLAAGAIETLTGTGSLDKLGGMVRTRPMLATGFMLSALALAGIPPTSGFVGKFLLIRSAFEVGAWLLGATAVVVSFFTLLSMIKIWNGVFWGEPTAAVAHERTQGPLGVEVPAATPRPTSPYHAAAGRAPPRDRAGRALRRGRDRDVVLGLARPVADRAGRAGGRGADRPERLPRGGACRMIVVRFLRRLPHIVVFLVTFAVDIVIANLRVAFEVVTPGYAMRVAIVRVPTHTRTPFEVTVLANVITMTPGTLSLEVDTDNYDLYVHGLYVDSLEGFRAQIAKHRAPAAEGDAMTLLDVALAAARGRVRDQPVAGRARPVGGRPGGRRGRVPLRDRGRHRGAGGPQRATAFIDVVLIATLLGFLATVALSALVGRRRS
jgi:multicomponent Na+:H+ antiporter subunit D